MPSTGVDRVTGNTTSVAVKAPVTVLADHQITLSGIQTIDGVTLQQGDGLMLPDRVLVNGQTDPTENGIYLVSTLAWIRAYDFNGERDAVQGTEVFVKSGTKYAQTTWYVSTTDNPIQFGTSHISFSNSSITPAVVDNLYLTGAASAAPDVTYVSLRAAGADAATGIGIEYQSLGTTILGFQYNGLVEDGTGRQKFQIAGKSQLEITDTYWNPNAIYAGPTAGWLVISGGGGDPTFPSDMIVGVLSVEAIGFPGEGCVGLSMIIGTKGPFGETHFLGNGALGHVTVDSPLNANPIAWDTYSALVNGVRFSGAFGGTGVWPQIKVAPSGDASDDHIGLTFYNFAKGGYDFSSGNSTTSILHLKHKDNATNTVNIEPGGAGISPIIYAGGAGANVRLTLAGSDTAGVDICNGGQYNGTAACTPIAKFNGAFETPEFLSVTAVNSANGGILVSVGANGGDTHAPLNLSSLGTDSVILSTAAGATAILEAMNAGTIKFRAAGAFTANGAVATVLGSIGPTGSHTTVQKWLTIVDNGSVTGYIPVF